MKSIPALQDKILVNFRAYGFFLDCFPCTRKGHHRIYHNFPDKTLLDADFEYITSDKNDFFNFFYTFRPFTSIIRLHLPWRNMFLSQPPPPLAEEQKYQIKKNHPYLMLHIKNQYRVMFYQEGPDRFYATSILLPYSGAILRKIIDLIFIFLENILQKFYFLKP